MVRMKLLVVTLAGLFLNLATIHADQSPLDTVEKGVDNFAFTYYKQLDFTDDNIAYSHLAVSMAMGMLLKGASGQTAQELKQILSIPNVADDDALHAKLLKILKTEAENPREQIKLIVSNLALLSKKIPAKQDYVDFVRKNYHALVDSVDFENDGNAIVDLINQFIKNRTLGVAPKLVDAPLASNTQLALVNTIYFKGQWNVSFPRENTHQGSFTNSDGSVSKVDMMHVITDVHKCKLQGNPGNLIQIHYKGNIVLNALFAKDITNTALAALNQTQVYLCTVNAVKTRINLYFPKFRLDSTHDVNKVLTKLGAVSVFDQTKADLSGITDFKPFALSNILTRVVFNFNEEGTDADLAGEAAKEPLEQSKAHDSNIETIRFDHPFGFSILDRNHKFAIAAGIVNKL